MHPVAFLCAFFSLYYMAQLSTWLVTAFLGCISLFYWVTSIRTPPAMHPRRKAMFSTWKMPQEGNLYGALEINAEPLLEAKTHVKASITVFVIKAAAMAMRVAPGLNGTFVHGTFVPHEDIDVACLVAVDDGADLASAKIERGDKLSLSQISNQLRRKAEAYRKHQDKDFEARLPLFHMLPVWILQPLIAFSGYLSGALGLKISPFGLRPYPFGSVMVTSVGNMGIELGFAPLVPYSRVPIVVLIGAITDKARVVNGTVVPQKVLTLTCTIDHRYAHGVEIPAMTNELRRLLENPHLLSEDEEQKISTSNESYLK